MDWGRLGSIIVHHHSIIGAEPASGESTGKLRNEEGVFFPVCTLCPVVILVMNIKALCSGDGQWDLVTRLPDHDHSHGELVEHLVKDDVILELIEEEGSHVWVMWFVLIFIYD